MTVIPIRLSPLEARLARYKLGVDAEALSASSDGPVIVGEMPGKRTSPKLPVFPYPHSSAGGRLLKMSGLDAATYLSSFHRVNLVEEYDERWPTKTARLRAEELYERYRGRPMVLLGNRVGEAFGVTPTFAWTSPMNMTPIVKVPHPSGLNRLHNTEQNRLRTGAMLREALVRWHRPAFHVAGDEVCDVCSVRADLHPKLRDDLPLVVDCSDVVWLPWPRYS